MPLHFPSAPYFHLSLLLLVMLLFVHLVHWLHVFFLSQNVQLLLNPVLHHVLHVTLCTQQLLCHSPCLLPFLTCHAAVQVDEELEEVVPDLPLAFVSDSHTDEEEPNSPSAPTTQPADPPPSFLCTHSGQGWTMQGRLVLASSCKPDSAYDLLACKK